MLTLIKTCFPYRVEDNFELFLDLCEVFLGVIDYPHSTQCGDPFQVRGAAYPGDLCPESLCQLHGCATDRSRRSIDQYLLARFDLPSISQEGQCCQCTIRDGGGLLIGEISRHPDHCGLSCDGFELSIATKVIDAVNCVACFEASNPWTDFRDLPGKLLSQDWISGLDETIKARRPAPIGLLLNNSCGTNPD